MPHSIFTAILAACAMLAGLSVGCENADRSETGTVMVFAAASTTDAVQELAALFRNQTGIGVELNFASSGQLARQIESGAPAEVFLSANPRWMDHLADRGLLVEASRVDLLGNRLVVIVPARTRRVPEPPEILTPEAGTVLDGGRLAIGDPDHVPAGAYAMAALESMGWRPLVDNRLVPARDVRSVVTFVQRGEVAAGIVYATDAAASAGVTVTGRFPADAHPPIRYPLARCQQPQANPAAERFHAFLQSEQAGKVFTRHGFEVLGPGGG